MIPKARHYNIPQPKATTSAFHYTVVIRARKMQMKQAGSVTTMAAEVLVMMTEHPSNNYDMEATAGVH
jgi:hypothetical protein